MEHAAPDHGPRVVVRHRLPDGRANDVIGDLVARDRDHLVVWPDDRPPITIATGLVIACRPVPPRVTRPSSSIAALARTVDAGWPGVERIRLGGWVLKASGGFTGRANSVLALGDPGLPLPVALDAVEEFYRVRDLPAKVQVARELTGHRSRTGIVATAGDGPGLDAALAARGYTCDDETLLMTSRLGGVAQPTAPGIRVEVSASPTTDWLGLYQRTASTSPATALAVLTASRHQDFVTGYDADGAPVTCGRLAVVDGWAGVSAMQVRPDARRRGLGRWLLGVLLGRGMNLGARFGYLQVLADNQPAIGLYRSAGFTVHHRYHYRTLPG